MKTLYANQNETLDAICFRSYGITARVVEEVLKVNPGLCELGPVLPMGTAVLLPDIETQQTTTSVNIWD
ncbi:phage tail protein X [Alteromonadaceae bacterium 2753L.S.0a.02]|nr:phage tail protein X [Alteromonadaceae bacterium 2753L.S.0a.02]